MTTEPLPVASKRKTSISRSLKVRTASVIRSFLTSKVIPSRYYSQRGKDGQTLVNMAYRTKPGFGAESGFPSSRYQYPR